MSMMRLGLVLCIKNARLLFETSGLANEVDPENVQICAQIMHMASNQKRYTASTAAC